MEGIVREVMEHVTEHPIPLAVHCEIRGELGRLPLVVRGSRMVIGLTGRYCAGKDTAARVFAARGFRVVDADDLEPRGAGRAGGEVIRAFGPSARARRTAAWTGARSARIVFADPAARTRLEAHPVPRHHGEDQAVHRGRRRRRRHQRRRSSSGWACETICDAVVFVTAPAARPARPRHAAGPAVASATPGSGINAQKDVRPQLNEPGVDTYSVPNWGSVRSLERRVERIAGAAERIGAGWRSRRFSGSCSR